jgi:hypothetical protein
VPSTVGSALAQIGSALTSADLPALLGQAGSPLSAAQIQQIEDEIAALQALPAGSTIPTGALSAVAQALDTVADQPGVPAEVASTLHSVASTLDPGGPLDPGALASAIPALADLVPTLDSVPLTGPALGSLAGALGTELAATPAAGSGGSGGSGGNTYIEYVEASQPKASTAAQAGASIATLRYLKSHVRVTLKCPLKRTAACRTTIYFHVGSWRDAVRTVSVTRGTKKIVSLGLPHLASVGIKQGRALVVTATTGSFTTHRHTLHIPLHR